MAITDRFLTRFTDVRLSQMCSQFNELSQRHSKLNISCISGTTAKNPTAQTTLPPTAITSVYLMSKNRKSLHTMFTQTVCFVLVLACSISENSTETCGQRPQIHTAAGIHLQTHSLGLELYIVLTCAICLVEFRQSSQLKQTKKVPAPPSNKNAISLLIY